MVCSEAAAISILMFRMYVRFNRKGLYSGRTILELFSLKIQERSEQLMEKKRKKPGMKAKMTHSVSSLKIDGEV